MRSAIRPERQRPLTRRRRVPWPQAGLALVVLGAASIAVAQPPRFRQLVAVEAPADVAKSIAAAEEFAADARWDDALDLLLTVQDTRPGALVEVQPGRYMQARGRIQTIIAAWPAGGLDAYRRRVDARAAALRDVAIAEWDPTRLREVAVAYPLTPGGIDAAWRMGEHLWRRGNAAGARDVWEPLARLADRESDAAGIRQSDLLARLILCSIAERDFERADWELAMFRERRPESDGTLGGVAGPLPELLEQALAEAREWAADTGDTPIADGVAIDGLAWIRSLQAAESHRALSWPATDGRNLFLVRGGAIIGLSLATGEPAWPSGDPDDAGILYRRPENPFLRDAPATGTPILAPQASGGRLFAVAGPSPSAGPVDRIAAVGPPLVALDIADGEGRLLWSQGIEGSLARSDWFPSGPPVASGGAVWVPLQRSESPRKIGLARLRAADGQVDWLRPVCSPIGPAGEAMFQWETQWLAPAGGRMILATPFGAVAAVNADTGETEWLTTFPYEPPPQAVRDHPERMRSAAPVCWRGIVCVAPHAGGDIRAWEERSGEPLWHVSLPERGLQLAGVCRDGLIASGRRLWSIDPASGQVRWRLGFEDEDGAGAGVPALIGSTIAWCTQRDLLLVDAATGELLQRMPIREAYGLAGGDLRAASGRLLLSSPAGLAAFRLSSKSVPIRDGLGNARRKLLEEEQPRIEVRR
ncbi:MAG: PQQ-binding-like beta-propeller repeat protein [Planctomyces sp.]|nr:PQQ-binding-like beta-propeller repeat protein [Planctomyces sp.]